MAGFLASNNWPGSSGYSAGDWTGASGAGGGGLDTSNDWQDFPVWDATTGRVHSRKTGQLYTGSWGGKQYANGMESAVTVPYSGGKSINPNDPSQRYFATNIPKGSPAAVPAANLQASFDAGTAEGLKDFSSYLSTAKGQVPGAIAASARATDIAPTVSALTGAQTRYSGDLAASNQRYQQQLAANAAAEGGVVSQANADLGLYDTALSRAEMLAQQAAGGVVSRYGRGKNIQAGGAVMGLGTDIGALALSKSYEASLPYEMAKVNQRYSNLSNFNLPVARDIGQQGLSYASSYLPGIASAEFSSSQGTTRSIQTLKEAAAAQDWQAVQQIMNLPGAAAAIRNAIYGGDLQLLSAFNQLYSQTNYQGLQDIMGTNLSQPQGFNQGNPALPGPGSSPSGQPRYPMGNPQTPGAGGAPVSRYPSQPYPGSNDPTLQWPYVNPDGSPRNYSPSGNANPNMQFDPATGRIIDMTALPQGTYTGDVNVQRYGVV